MPAASGFRLCFCDQCAEDCSLKHNGRFAGQPILTKNFSSHVIMSKARKLSLQTKEEQDRSRDIVDDLGARLMAMTVTERTFVPLDTPIPHRKDSIADEQLDFSSVMQAAQRLASGAAVTQTTPLDVLSKPAKLTSNPIVRAAPSATNTIEFGWKAAQGAGIR